MAAKPSTPSPSGPSERLRSAYEAVGEASAGRSAATLFSSFDLVNSTSYKTRAADDWPQVTQNFYYGVERAVESASSDDDDLRPEVWKYIGDEVVMLTEVFSVKDAERVVALTAAVCTALQKQFSAKDGATSLQRSEQLGVKASCWLALSANRTSNATRNIEFQPRVFPIRDFLGPDIDAGFRIGKRAMRGAVTLTAPLAQVLLDDGVGQSRHIRLAGYDVLKGVWDGRPYPRLLYRLDWHALADEFDYDELMGQKLRRVPKGHLRKILVQTGNFDAVERLREYFEAARRPPPYARGSGMESEVHVAAACVDVEGRRVLMRRRRLGKGVEKPGVWDFGCAVLTGQRPAPETLVDEYRTKYGIDLVVNDPTPLSYFSFPRRGRFVSGFVFGARARNPNAKLAPHNDDQLAWFSLDQPPPSDSVKDASAVFAGLRARYG